MKKIIIDRSVEPIFEKIESLVKKKEVKFIFLLGKHGSGKTVLLNHYLEKYFSYDPNTRFCIVKVGVSTFHSLNGILLRLISTRLKALMLFLSLSLVFIVYFFMKMVFSFLYWNVFFISNNEIAHYKIPFDLFFNFFLAGSGFFFLSNKFQIFFSISQKVRGWYYYMHDKLCACYSRVWIDDLERASLTYSEQWQLIDYLSETREGFLVSIGYKDESERELYSERIRKFSDNLTEKGFIDSTRTFELDVNPGVNYSIVFQYFNKHLSGHYPFIDNGLDWICLFTPREISRILVLINAEKLKFCDKDLFFEKDSNLKKALYWISFKVFFKSIASKLSLDIDRFIDNIYFCLDFYAASFRLEFAAHSDINLAESGVFENGFHVKITDLAESLKGIDANSINHLKIDARYMWTDRLVPKEGNKKVYPINDLISGDFSSDFLKELVGVTVNIKD